MKAKTIIALATLLAFGQGAWADGTTSFPLHYNAETNPEDGSEAHPYQIQSVSDLNALASDVNSGTNYSGKHFKLTADLNYSGETFTTIGKGEESGSEDFPFKGIFEAFFILIVRYGIFRVFMRIFRHFSSNYAYFMPFFAQCIA